MEKTDEEYCRFQTPNVFIEKNIMWMPLNGLYRLGKINLKMHDIEVVANLFDERRGAGYKYNQIVRVGRKVILTGIKQVPIAIYDEDNSTVDFVDVPVPPKSAPTWKRKGRQFADICVWGENVYLIGDQYPGILQMKLSERKIVYVYDWIQKIPKEQIKNRNRWFADGHIIRKNKLLIPFSSLPYLLELDMDTEQCGVRKMPSPFVYFDNLTEEGDAIWCTGRVPGKAKCYCADEELTHFAEVSLPQAEYELENENRCCFQKPVCSKEYVYLISMFGRHSFQIDKNDLKAIICKEIDKILDGQSSKNGRYTLFAKCVNQNVFFMTCKDALFCRYDAHSGEVTYRQFILPEDEVVEAKERELCMIIKNKGIADERDIPLKIFLNSLKEKSIY